ncbi:hypothetical protein [Nocardia brasiliensis]|uniref:transmembrane-type terpene cyclase n=1 Tax=Nocardia brasiliensis TaxID=37326 RepID=UPI0036710CB8
MWFPPYLIDLPTVAPVVLPPRDFHSIGFYSIVTGLAVCWLIAYGLAIHRGFVDKRVGIPAAFVCANIAWEFMHSLVIQQDAELRPFYLAWALVDILILYQVLKWGNRDFPSMSRRAFRGMVAAIIAYAAALTLLMTYEFKDPIGLYDGAGLNILLSTSFILMLRSRGSSAGQSMYIALFKWAGTALGALNTIIVFPERRLLLFLFATVSILDFCYMTMLYRQIRREGANPWQFNRPPVPDTPVRTPVRPAVVPAG